MLLTSATGTNIPTPAEIPDTIIVDTREEKETLAQMEEKVDAEEYVKNYFADTPVLAEIAKCESHYRHTDNSGEVTRGRKNNQDVGVMQINEKYHLDQAIKLGYDIYSLEGNLEYAKYLYNKEGARPWLASSSCWSGNEHIAKR